MKPRKSPFAQLSAIFSTILICSSVQAGTLYWDTNGTTAGSGAATGNWDSSNFWSTDATGATAPGTYVAGSDVVFSAGAASGTTQGTAGTAGTVTLNSTLLVNSLTFNQPNLPAVTTPPNPTPAVNNTVTISGNGTIDFGSNQGTIKLSTGASTTTSPIINTLISGTGGLSFTSTEKGSSVTLGGANTGLSGNISIGGAVESVEVGVNNANALGSGAINVLNTGVLHIGPNTNNVTFGNAITIAGNANGRGALRMSFGANVTGGVTLAANSQISAVNTANTISGADLSLGAFNATVGFVNQGSLTISSKITGTGQFIVNGNGTANYSLVTLTNTGNTFTGGVNIVNAGLALGNDTALGTGTLTLSGGGGTNSPRIQSSDATTRTINNVLAIGGTNTANILYFGATTSTTGSGLTGTGDLIFANTTATNLNVTARTFQIDNATTEFRSAFTGSAPTLTKQGLGTMLMSGASTYSGSTVVKAGTFKLSSTGSIDGSSGVVLSTGAKFDVSAKSAPYAVKSLSGSGQVVGALNVTTALSAGEGSASYGVLNLDNLALATTAATTFEILGGANSADLVNINGNLTLAGALTLTQTGTYTAGQKFTLFAYTGTQTGTFTGLADDSTFTQGGGQWVINYNDTSAGLNGGTGTSFVTVTAMPIPEPSAMLLGSVGLLALFRRRRTAA